MISSMRLLFENIAHVGSFSFFVFVFVFVLLVRRSYLISLHHLLFKNISHHVYFQGFTARELCGANKWDEYGFPL